MAVRGLPVRPDLNVTPLIDILLVLLVIFLTTVTLSHSGLDTTIPSQTRSASTPAGTDQIVLEYTADGHVSINHQPVTIPELPLRLREIFQHRSDKTMYILGDARLRYRAIIEVMDAARGAGVSRIGVITERMRPNAS